MNRRIHELCSLAIPLAACVPTEVDPNPAGAIGIQLEPSAATRGEPFLTRDGWTIQILSLALQRTLGFFLVSDSAATSGYSSAIYGDNTKRWSARNPLALFITGQPAQRGCLRIDQSSYRRGDERFGTTVESFPISDSEQAKFQVRPANPVPSSTYASDELPDTVVHLRANKAERTIELDLTLTSSAMPWAFIRKRRAARPATQGSHNCEDAPWLLTTVRADTLTLLPTAIRGENLLGAHEFKGALFDPLADADSNRDGVLSPEELDATSDRNDTSEDPMSLMMLLAVRAAELFEKPGP